VCAETSHRVKVSSHFLTCRRSVTRHFSAADHVACSQPASFHWLYGLVNIGINIAVLFASPLDLELRKKLVKCYVWSIALYGAETWTVRARNQKYMESFEMWCWRRMEKISWTDHVRNEDVLLRVKEQRNILHEIRKRKANWIGHILHRNCLLQRVTEGKVQRGIEVTGRQRRRRMKLLDDLKERRGYCHLKEEALDRTMWRAHFGRGFGPVVRQTAK